MIQRVLMCTPRFHRRPQGRHQQNRKQVFRAWFARLSLSGRLRARTKVFTITTTGIKGLPKVLRRGVIEKVESRPNILLFDLPVPPSNASDAVPRKFGSNVLLERLESMQPQDLPVFGVSGMYRCSF